MFSCIPSGFRGIKEWGSPIFMQCASSNTIQNNVIGNQISVREIIECTEKDDYWMYSVSSQHYLPPLYVHLSCMSQHQRSCVMVTLVCTSWWICCLWSILPTQLGTACSSHWAIDLSLTSWFYLNPCLWPCPLCFGSMLHFAKRSGLCCSIAAFFPLKNLPRGQSCKLYPSSILIHHLDQAAESLQRLKQNQLCVFLDSLS